MILIVSATEHEVLPILKDNSKPIPGFPITLKEFNNAVDLMVTGVGTVQTAFHLSRAIQSKKYDLILNIGIGGAFSDKLKIGDVVLVIGDTFGDLGIDNRGSFVSIFQSGLMDPDQPPFHQGKLIWPYKNQYPKLNSFHEVRGVTVSTTSGSVERIVSLSALYNAEIETMEVAAVFYCCLSCGVPFICLRSISNRVEPRDTKKWNIPLAIQNVNMEAENVINYLIHTIK